MENITHSLLGAALAEIALPSTATTAQRRLFFAAGIIASNLPDADLLYTRITPPPLGYLLHHRGHTHTLVGLLAQALLLGAICLTPIVRRHIGSSHARLLALIAVSLLGHLVLDSWNSYGVHPFYPFDNSWYYGDAIYILEPWLWVLLGVAAVANARNDRVQITVAALLGVITAALAWFGMIVGGAFAALAIAATVSAWAIRDWSPRRRSSVALAATAIFVAAMFGVRHIVRGKVVASLSRGDIVDVILSPTPANPFCWSVLTVEKNEPAGEFVLRRGSAAVLSPIGCGRGQGASVAWVNSIRQPLAKLRNLSHDDCWVRAWLQFGRAPILGGDANDIADFRFGGTTRANFTDMQILPRAQAAVCPPNLTHWGMPRTDLLTPSI